ncbi:uncharacterized protein A4U43_C08F23780 [Asparagus officinalis]|nr:uncharacterized protein A4U43_C08F23780 [Asparagus officinalis]
MRFFKHHGGLTETHIRKLIANYPRILNRTIKRGQGFIRRSLGSIEALLRRVQELGFDVKSPMFGRASSALSGVRMDNVDEKMEFLLKKAGCEQSCIASNPLLLLLMVSSEKRLKPRHLVLQILKSKEIVQIQSLVHHVPL